MINAKLAQKFNKSQQQYISGMTDPVEYGRVKNDFLDNLTRKAVQMYERKCDIKHFTGLVLSNPENTSHNDIVNGLIENGMIDPFEDDKLELLADNKKLLRDLGLSE